jgi:hypothetical protein
MKQALIVVLAALGLSACGSGWGYAYDYDPYLGPRGHYVSPFDHRPARAAPPCARVVYSGPYEGGYRGPYYAGPFCADAQPAAWSPPPAGPTPAR